MAHSIIPPLVVFSPNSTRCKRCKLKKISKRHEKGHRRDQQFPEAKGEEGLLKTMTMTVRSKWCEHFSDPQWGGRRKMTPDPRRRGRGLL